MTQKFLKGNVVRVLFGHPGYNETGVIDISPEEVGREALILGSYADLYGGDNRGEYSIIFCDTGQQVAWKNEDQLEFISEGGNHLFVDAFLKKKEVLEQRRSLVYIVNNWNNKQGISSDSILYLFELVSFESRFFERGEFAHLYMDWERLSPLFDAIMRSEKVDAVLQLIEPENNKINADNIILLFDKVKEIQKS